MPLGKAIWNANGGFVSVLLTHLLKYLFYCNIEYSVDEILMLHLKFLSAPLYDTYTTPRFFISSTQCLKKPDAYD